MIEPTVYLLLGYPGTGKLTIANEMVRQIEQAGRSVRLVDNHSINDPLLRLVKQDGSTRLSESFWQNVEQVRHAVFSVIERISPPEWSFIFTMVLLNDPADLRLVDRHAGLAAARGNRFQIARLTIDEDENARRVISPEHHDRMKLNDPGRLGEIRTQQVAAPVAYPLIELDVTNLSPIDAARQILRR